MSSSVQSSGGDYGRWNTTMRDISQPVSLYLTPKHTLLLATKAGMAKADQPWWHVLLLSFSAGCFVAFGEYFALALAAGFTNDGVFVSLRDAGLSNSTVGSITIQPAGLAISNPGIIRLVMGLAYPVAFAMIIWCGGELFTGNFLMFMPAWWSCKVSGLRVAQQLLLAYIGNYAGCVFIAFLIHFGSLSNVEPLQSFIISRASTKIGLNVASGFIRGALANWLICAAFWMAMSSQDGISKIFGIWIPTTAFVAMNFEHSISDMFSCSLAFMEGLNEWNYGQWIVRNLLPVTVGNIVGGCSLFVAIQWIIYGVFAMPTIAKMRIPSAKHMHTPISPSHQFPLPADYHTAFLPQPNPPPQPALPALTPL